MGKSKGLAAFCVILAVATTPAAATEGVNGTTLRPAQDKAKVDGCKIAKPGAYEVAIGDIIELDYTYPVVPDAIPKKVDHKQTLGGSVVMSSLGFRSVSVPHLLGVGTIAFYFEAKRAGGDTITLIIDGEEYEYKFRVAGAEKEETLLPIRQQTAFQVDPIKIRVVGKEDFKVHRMEVVAKVPGEYALPFRKDDPVPPEPNGRREPNGKVTFFGKCTADEGLWHWGDCARYEDSFSMDVWIGRRYEEDTSGLNRPGYVIHAVQDGNLSSLDADGKVFFFNGPPRTTQGHHSTDCPYRLVINTKDQNEVVQAISMEPIYKPAADEKKDVKAADPMEGVVSGLDVQKQQGGFKVFAFITNSDGAEIQVVTTEQRFQTTLEQASGNYATIKDHKPKVEVDYKVQDGENVITRIRFEDR